MEITPRSSPWPLVFNSWHMCRWSRWCNVLPWCRELQLWFECEMRCPDWNSTLMNWSFIAVIWNVIRLLSRMNRLRLLARERWRLKIYYLITRFIALVIFLLRSVQFYFPTFFLFGAFYDSFVRKLPLISLELFSCKRWIIQVQVSK